jgi:Glycine zipper
MIKKILLMAVTSSLITACASNTPNYGYGQNYGLNGMNKAVIGGGIGAVAGAAVGTAFGGNDLGNAGMGALVGGALGAGVGAIVDHQQQRRQQQQQGGWNQNQPYYNGYNQ